MPQSCVWQTTLLMGNLCHTRFRGDVDALAAALAAALAPIPPVLPGPGPAVLADAVAAGAAAAVPAPKKPVPAPAPGAPLTTFSCDFLLLTQPDIPGHKRSRVGWWSWTWIACVAGGRYVDTTKMSRLDPAQPTTSTQSPQSINHFMGRTHQGT